MVALDWWNGNRSVLVDVDLTGMILGMTLATRAEEIYRALIEATAYGTRIIIETFEQYGVPVTEIVATGGLPDRNKLLMQIYADVSGRTIKVSGTKQAVRSVRPCTAQWRRARQRAASTTSSTQPPRWRACTADVYTPNPEAKAVYDRLFAEYVKLHDYFGRGENDVMKRLKALKAEVLKN